MFHEKFFGISMHTPKKLFSTPLILFYTSKKFRFSAENS